MRSRLKTYDFHVIALLKLGPLDRRPRGWRFGLRRIPDHVVDRLVAAGRAQIAGNQVHLAEREQRP
ncbi:hypothetical protein IVA87_34055 [Bradyrhizobium sp. 147]|uniref:hypothetical protein n=1 Tax=Bradyrhizobium sp. 147 TaxID=2782623 RepID=UPI001FFA2B80|nr:hypothetical protein [Bradyrhizobium sp. 147]MCK1684279.1 hypothetical protein [Bradyrhizobium sp. 147]